jgi:hypothetical protein
MEQAVQEGGDRGGVAEQLPPVLARTVRGEQRRRPLIAAHDDLQEILGRGLGQLPHPEIVEDQERDRGDGGQVRLAGALELGVGELLEQQMGFAIEDAVALLYGGEANRLGEVALAGAARPPAG